MRKARLSLVAALALVLTLGLAASSWARPWGPGGFNLTPEQAGKLFDLRQKFMDDTAGLRKQMWVKRLELRDLWRAEKPDEKQILAKQKELNSVRDQLLTKATTFRLEARKIAPNAGFCGGFGGGPGWGHGMMGPGGGWGPGPVGPGGMGPGGGAGPGKNM